MAGYDSIPSAASLRPEKYKISFPEQQLSDFKNLLKLSPLAPHTYENLQGDGRFGVTYDWMSKAKEYWENQYNWRHREEWFNSFPNYTVDVEDKGESFHIHFAALFSKRQDAIPLLFLHGWPGSHLEFLGVLDRFRKRYSPEELPFHIINPSLPGYTLSSGPPTSRNFETEDCARVLNKLMVGLGFESGYIAQGGDVGSYVSRILSAKHDACKAIHLNFSMDLEQPEGVNEADINDAEKKGLKRMRGFIETGSAYAQEHGTRPATIGFVLASSPLALLAWIGEKFIQWTDETPSLEDILDDVTLYWLTQSFPRCIYIYREYHGDSGAHTPHGDPEYRSEKPVGYSWFPQELAPIPKAWVERMGNLVWHRQHDSGGHFAALEKPEVLMADVEDFAKQVWQRK
ncbi:hypothetical protein LTR10_019511 [Elasticomyces elasticus]|uniref:Epoxide hydrolase N-terminal domain-containing protein n=1 Tax=Exophiala sideris TaxID=1016849 RepID=A0ABR0JKU5_9EURO|nr:hypothetical protein LTR10_019511 [Elasticomyces elasticus]KAK5035484.1 hypothetical protein LTS07_002923 [Exophiala sideris]KAK5039164.1 hypothetical protein LTR13_003420 [Exophiala sideris]KAK5066409.1 hypothetical protein LTR69_002929 [Exophiala sideris]KAK5187086.1 hypothetical protein LTR44_001094 [Eurotiomycetes sp. CCFEE 6388]